MALPNRRSNRGLTGLRLVAATFLVAAAGEAGCAKPPEVMDEDSYVEIMAQLSAAQADYIEPERADSAKLALLDELGVDPDDLVAFSARYGDDIERMSELWRRISVRVDSLGEEEMREKSRTPEKMPPGGDSR